MESIEKEVSWPSAFCALIALALNSVAQPAGRLWPGLNQAECAILRVSPLVCLVDAVHVRFVFVSRAFQSRSWRKAQCYITRRRFKEASAANSPTSVIHGLQENRPFRMPLFGFGALPQSMKLMSYGGIFLPKIAASCYIGSFIIFEALVVHNRRGLGEETSRSSDNDNIDDTYEETTRLGSYTSQHRGSLHRMWNRLSQRNFWLKLGSWTHSLLLMAAQIHPLSLIRWFIPSERHSTTSEELALVTLCLLIHIDGPNQHKNNVDLVRAVFLIGLWNLANVYQLFGWKWILSCPNSAVGILGTMVLFISAPLMTYVGGQERCGLVPFIAYIASTFYYFAIIYDSGETNKPAWTELFG